MKIPLVARLPSDGRINKGAWAGQSFHYKTALLNTLLHLRPLVCLEIGTHYGGSARVFMDYFDLQESALTLVTTDICEYVQINDNRVRQLLVYPHVADVFERHNFRASDLLPDWAGKIDESVEVNCRILREALDELGCETFDFAFVDGDHSEVSLRKDLEIVRRMTAPPHYALLDDTFEYIHESGALYQEHLIHEYAHYDFEDWDIFAGASLVWKM